MINDTPLGHSPRHTRTGRQVAYLLGLLPILMVGFIIVVTLVVGGAGMAIMWVGLPILVAGLHGAGALATADLHVRRQAFGTPLPPERHAPADPDARPLARLLSPLRDPQAWRDVLWVVVSFFVSIITWSIALTWVVGIVAGFGSIIAHPILEAALGPNRNGLGELLRVPFPMFFDIVTSVGLGVLFLLTLPRVIGGLTKMQTGVSDLLIAGPAHDRAENERLRTSRSSARKAETDALRRLERDLHDGPQQRLIRLQMDLARAKRAAASDPDRAETLITDALDQTQATLAELRQLSRGIAPPILVDRGLEAAIEEAAGRSGTPVTVYANLPELPDHVATAAYFLVSEGLANINKHAGARAAEVFASVQDDHLYLTVADDGIGGASLDKGHGLAGLADRLRGVDGNLSITSPLGGPTRLEAVIPCAS